MAFGIDDALMSAAAGINLTDTIVRTVQGYRGTRDVDIERLIEEVRITALKGIDEADETLRDFERLLVEKGVDLTKTLQETINGTPWWRPVEQMRLKKIRRSFNILADATYDASDDIAALVRCRDQTRPMGVAIVESAPAKHLLFSRLLEAPSVRTAIDLLRSELARHKRLLS